jgi:hypothetical protein
MVPDIVQADVGDIIGTFSSLLDVSSDESLMTHEQSSNSSQ